MPPSKTTTTAQAEADKAAAAQAEADKAAAAQAEADKAAAAQAEADKAAASKESKNAERKIGTAEEPSEAPTPAAMKKLGIEALSWERKGENLICAVLQDAKRVWKEYFHEA